MDGGRAGQNPISGTARALRRATIKEARSRTHRSASGSASSEESPISERCLKRHRWHCSLRSSLNINDYYNWHGKATSAGQVFCKRRSAPQSSPFWSHLSRLCKMQVLNKGLAMRSHEFFLRLTIAEFQILNTKKS